MADLFLHQTQHGRSGRGFGIDCAGLVGEVARKAGAAYTLGNTTGNLSNTSAAESLPWREVRGGDFAVVSGSHVVLATGVAQLEGDGNPTALPTIEADGNSRKVVTLTRRNTDKLPIASFVLRRWKTP